MTKGIYNPHDRFFRSAMSDVRVAKEFFLQHLPADILEIIDLASLRFQKTSFIDEELKTSIADVVYAANIKNKRGYLYTLVEHQSTVDHWIAFRLWCYMIRIMQFHHRQYPEEDLPVVYPLIFYNGVTEYSSTTDFYDLFGEHKYLAREIFTGPFQLIDIQKIQDEELRQYQWAGILEFVLKHRFARDFLAFAEQLMQWLHQLELEDGYDYVRIVLKYVADRLEGKDTATLVAVAKQQLTPEMGGEFMTFTEQARRKGYEEALRDIKAFADQAEQEGYEKALQEKGKVFADHARQYTALQIAKKMLEKRMPKELIIETTGLSKVDVQALMLTVEVAD